MDDYTVVSYRLFPVLNVSTFESGNGFDQVVEYVNQELLPTVDGDGHKYLWNREAFNLSVLSWFGFPCLYGQTNVGSCLEDEWTIVYLLLKISRRFPQLAIQVNDSDGEFLLIEAAEDIPKWLTPDNSDNRVWIMGGRLGIYTPGKEIEDRSPSFKQVMQSLRDPSATEHDINWNERVQTKALWRIEDFPRVAIENNCHRALVTTPRKIAALLHQYPVYLSAALNLLSAEHLETHPALTNPSGNFATNDKDEGLVTWAARFTRFQYAQTLGQSFRPPQKFINSIFPSYHDEDDRMQLGAKLTAAVCLLQDHCKDFKEMTTHDKNDDFYEFILPFIQSEYFNGVDSDSDEHERRQQRAMDAFLRANEFQNENAYLSSRLSNLELPTDEELAAWDKTEDSDQWLNIFLDEGDYPQGADEMSARVREMMDRVNKFVDDQNAGLDGINVYEDSSSSSSSDSEDDDTDGNAPGPSKGNWDADDPKIDEDDFLEFFLQEALKLPPEEIEKYRADNSPESAHYAQASQTAHASAQTANTPDNQEFDSDSSDDDWDQVEQDLRRSGALTADSDPFSYEALQNLLQSIQSGGGITGPAATLLGQLNINLEDLMKGLNK
uniref:ARAD1B04048p n=1 Tax=Blastobotrys adeninivorans TaxID=409370 RepID=A0A060T4J7_BLAAD